MYEPTICSEQIVIPVFSSQFRARAQAGMKELQNDHNRLIAQGQRATVQKEANARSYSLRYDGGTGDFQFSIFNCQLSYWVSDGGRGESKQVDNMRTGS